MRSAIAGGDRTSADRPILYTVFLDPGLGRIWLVKRDARSKGYDVRVEKLRAAEISRAKTSVTATGSSAPRSWPPTEAK